MIKKLKKLSKNQILPFVSLNYLSYSIQFVDSIIIAKLLGPYLFGIWGFLLLVLQYTAYSNLGTPHSLTVSLSTLEENNKKLVDQIFNRFVFLTIIISTPLIFLGIIIEYGEIVIFEKYDFKSYAFEIALITVLRNFNLLYTNYYRTLGNLNKISFAKTSFPLSLLIAILLFLDGLEVQHLLYAYIFSQIVPLILFNTKLPNKINYRYFSLEGSKEYIIRGFNLFIYNMSFVLFAISTRTLISIFYDVEKLGIYSFSDSLVRGISLGLGAFTFAIYSKLIYKVREDIENHKVLDIIHKLRSIYINSSFLISFLVIVISVLLNNYLTEYTYFDRIFILLILADLIVRNSIGFSHILISRKNEIKLSILALSTLLINILVALILISLGIEFYLVAISNVLSGFFYNFLVIKIAYSNLGYKKSFKTIIKQIYPIKIIIPYLLIFLNLLSIHNLYVYLGCVLLFVLINLKNIYSTIKVGYGYLTDSSLLKNS